jgi:hypothetical protein
VFTLDISKGHSCTICDLACHRWMLWPYPTSVFKVVRSRGKKAFPDFFPLSSPVSSQRIQIVLLSLSLCAWQLPSQTYDVLAELHSQPGCDDLARSLQCPLVGCVNMSLVSLGLLSGTPMLAGP